MSLCPPQVIYSGRKLYKTLHLHSSTRNSWRNQWLRLVTQPRNLFWRGSHWRLSNGWKLIQSTSKNLNKFVSGGPWHFRPHSGCATGCGRSKKTAIVRYSMRRGCAARHTTKGATGQLYHPKFSTTSYKHFASTWKYQLIAAYACAGGWIVEKSTFSQSSWCAVLRDSIRWNDWSWQWFPVTLASSTDCICSLSWQGTHGNRRSLGRSSVLYSYLHSHRCSHYLWKIGKWLLGTRHGVDEMQNCANGRCNGGGRIRNDVVALIKQIAPEVVSIHCVIHREALVAKKLGNEEDITK